MGLETRARATKSGRLEVTVDAALAEPAEVVLEAIAGFEGKGKGLAHDVKVQVGWSVFILRRDGETLRVTQPDFSGDPFRDVVDDCSASIGVITEQADLCRRLKVTPVDATFQQTIIVRKGCLTETGLYLERQRPAKRTADSGWYVGPLDQEAPPASDDLEAMATYHLFRHRPEILKVLALPVGWLVSVDGKRIVDIANEKNETVWVG
jgi:hypothetical protein